MIFWFGLLVTGETEAEHLPKLFKSLMNLGICQFEIIARVGQRSNITSAKKTLKMIGSGKIIPDRDVEENGIAMSRESSDQRTIC